MPRPVFLNLTQIKMPVGALTSIAHRVSGILLVTVIPDGLGGFEHNAALLVADLTGRLVHVFGYAELDTALAFARSLAARGGAQ